MAGQILRILPKTDYDFSTLGAAGTQIVTFARRVDMSAWREAVVCFRVHSSSKFNASDAQKLELLWLPDGYTDEDPGQAWNTLSPTNLFAITNGTDSFPYFKVAALASGFPALLMFQMKATQVSASTQFKPTVSCDLVGRS